MRPPAAFTCAPPTTRKVRHRCCSTSPKLYRSTHGAAQQPWAAHSHRLHLSHSIHRLATNSLRLKKGKQGTDHESANTQTVSRNRLFAATRRMEPGDGRHVVRGDRRQRQ